MHPGGITAGDNLAGDRLEIVAEGHDMVTIPADAATDVEEDLRKVEEDARNLVGDRLGGMEVAGIETEELLPGDGIPEVKLRRPNRAGLGPDPKQLRLHRIEKVLGGQALFEHRIE